MSSIKRLSGPLILLAVILQSTLYGASGGGWDNLINNLLGKPLDATVGAPADNAILTYDSSTGRWKAAAASGTLTVQENDVNVDTPTTTLDFDSTDFNITSSPAGEANVAINYGTTAGTVCQGNDSRLSDARTPTAHASTHAKNGSDPLNTAAPVSVSTANSEGTANTFARSDHVHKADEVLSSDQLTDFSASKSGSGTRVVSNVGPTITSLIISDLVAFADSATNSVFDGHLRRNGSELSFDAGSYETKLEQVARKDAANGYPGLNASSKIDASQMSEQLSLDQLSTFGAGNEGEIVYRTGAGWDVLADGNANTVLVTDADGTGRSQALITNNNIDAAAGIVYSKLAFANNIVAGDLATDSVKADEIELNSVGTSEIVGGAPGAAGAELADTVTNVSGSTNLTLSPSGNAVVIAATKILNLAQTTTSRASLNVPSGTAPTSPANGDHWHDGSLRTFQWQIPMGTTALVGLVYTNGVDSTAIANTVTETIFSTNFTVPANSVTAGKKLRIRAHGKYSTTGSPTLRFGIRFNGVTLAQTGTIACGTGVTDSDWSVEAVMATNAASSSAAVRAHIKAIVDSTMAQKRAATTIDATAAGVLGITAQWSAPDPANTIMLEAITIISER